MTPNDVLTLFRAIHETPAKLEAAKVYHDLLGHFIRTSIPLEMEDGHCFKVELTEARMGIQVMTATDAYDGKKYRITVEPAPAETKPAEGE